MPLRITALWYSPSAAGVCSRVVILAPPPDWPNTVTLSGSPPKAATFSRSHCSAAMMSDPPLLPEFSYSGPKSDRSR